MVPLPGGTDGLAAAAERRQAEEATVKPGAPLCCCP